MKEDRTRINPEALRLARRVVCESLETDPDDPMVMMALALVTLSDRCPTAVDGYIFPPTEGYLQ